MTETDQHPGFVGVGLIVLALLAWGAYSLYGYLTSHTYHVCESSGGTTTCYNKTVPSNCELTDNIVICTRRNGDVYYK